SDSPRTDLLPGRPARGEPDGEGSVALRRALRGLGRLGERRAATIPAAWTKCRCGDACSRTSAGGNLVVPCAGRQGEHGTGCGCAPPQNDARGAIPPPERPRSSYTGLVGASFVAFSQRPAGATSRRRPMPSCLRGGARRSPRRGGGGAPPLGRARSSGRRAPRHDAHGRSVGRGGARVGTRVVDPPPFSPPRPGRVLRSFPSVVPHDALGFSCEPVNPND